MECCSGLFRIILVIFNTIFLLVGLVPLVLGSIALANEELLKKMLVFVPENVDEVVDIQELLLSFAVFFIVFGCVIVLVGIFGFFGACCDIKCLLYLYLTAILVIIAGEIVLLIIALAYPETFAEGGEKLLRKTFKDDVVQDGTAIFIEGNNPHHYINQSSDALSLGWNSMQFGLHCCGPSGFDDYNSTKFLYPRNQAALAPITCCKHVGRDIPTISKPSYGSLTTETRRCYTVGINPEDYNKQGCFEAMVNEATNSVIFIAVMAGIGALELLLVVATMALASRKE